MVGRRAFLQAEFASLEEVKLALVGGTFGHRLEGVEDTGDCLAFGRLEEGSCNSAVGTRFAELAEGVDKLLENREVSILGRLINDSCMF